MGMGLDALIPTNRALISIDYKSDRPTVMGRDLHRVLDVETPYTMWFNRMCEYGFAENADYLLVSQKCSTNNPKNPWTSITDHQLTLAMAKEICMLQRTDKGKAFRQYFISVEEQWNSPEAVMSRALLLSEKKIKSLQQQNNALLCLYCRGLLQRTLHTPLFRRVGLRAMGQ